MTLGKRNDRYTQALVTLYGGNVPKNIPTLFEEIARCLDDPKQFPNKVEYIINDEKILENRISLSRVQIESELRMREDVEYFTQRLWVAQTIEKMVFGGLMTEGEKLKSSEDDEEDD